VFCFWPLFCISSFYSYCFYLWLLTTFNLHFFLPSFPSIALTGFFWLSLWVSFLFRSLLIPSCRNLICKYFSFVFIFLLLDSLLCISSLVDYLFIGLSTFVVQCSRCFHTKAGLMLLFSFRILLLFLAQFFCLSVIFIVLLLRTFGINDTVLLQWIETCPRCIFLSSSLDLSSLYQVCLFLPLYPYEGFLLCLF
jgi:hypothetical protein